MQLGSRLHFPYYIKISCLPFRQVFTNYILLPTPPTFATLKTSIKTLLNAYLFQAFAQHWHYLPFLCNTPRHRLSRSLSEQLDSNASPYQSSKQLTYIMSVSCAHAFTLIKSDSTLIQWICQLCRSGPHPMIYECAYCKLHLCRMCSEVA